MHHILMIVVLTPNADVERKSFNATRHDMHI